MASTDNLEERLDRVEGHLAQVLAMLQAQAVASRASNGGEPAQRPNGSANGTKDGHVAVLTHAYRSGVDALSTVHGDDAMRESVADLVMRLGDPDTMASLTRVVTLLPELEYALNAVAAGPTLLEEGIDLARARLRAAGATDHDLRQRIDGAAGTLVALSEPRTAESLRRLAGHAPELVPVLEAAGTATSALAAVEGEDVLTERLTDTITALAEPETLDSLTRIAGLAPQIEYAVNALAAGPALLEEGIEVAHARLRESGIPPHEAQRRVDAAVRTAVKLSERSTLEALGQLSGLTPTLVPVANGAARAIADLSAVEGEEALANRFAETVVRLAEPETLDALTRIASLAPQIEYGVNALAAGPALLEEGIELAKAKLGEQGAHDVDRRLEAAGELLVGFSEPAVLQSLGQLSCALPAFGPVARAAAGAMADLAAVEGDEVLEARLRETLLTITEPETLDSLTRIVSLAPKLEYATYFLAAGPELFEEALGILRELKGDARTPQLEEALQAGLKAAKAVSDPRVLAGLSSLAEKLPSLLPKDEAFADALEELVGQVPDLTFATGLAAAAPKALDAAARRAGKRNRKDLVRHAEAALAAGVKLTEPDKLAAIVKLLDAVDLDKLATVAGKLDLDKLAALTDKLDPEQLAAMLDKLDLERLGELLESVDIAQVQSLLEKVDFETLGELIEALDLEGLMNGPLPTLKAAGEHLADAEKRDALIGLIELAPQLERPLRALPVQAATIHVLSAVNEAVEKAAGQDRSLGLFGTVGALRDPEVQRAVGFLMGVAKHLGRALDEPIAKLPAKKNEKPED